MSIYRPFDYDYRWGSYPGHGRLVQHPNDRSIMVYRGHAVLSTLIRAYISPLETTAGRYIYTGSACGRVYVYDALSGSVLRRLSWHEEVVRDVAWHPRRPMLASIGFDGCIARWEYRSPDAPVKVGQAGQDKMPACW